MADTGLIVTVVIFCFIFAWIITFSILAMALKKPVFEKLSIIGPLGHKIHLTSKGVSLADQRVHGIEKRGNITKYSSINQQPSTRTSINQIPDSTSREPITNGGYYDYDDANDLDPEF